jgi:hypothetical protein
MPSQQTPFAELAAMVQELRERRLDAGADARMVKDLLDASKRLEAVHATAAEMQLGAEGFDNTGSAALYSDVQLHLLAAGRELVKACARLKKEIEVWANLKR